MNIPSLAEPERSRLADLLDSTAREMTALASIANRKGRLSPQGTTFCADTFLALAGELALRADVLRAAA